MATTYEPIATATAASNGTAFTFSSIPSTYTDLRVVLSGTAVTNTATPRMQLNSDTATNYSVTNLYGTGTAAGTTKNNSTAYYINGNDNTGMSSTIPSLITVDIFSYAGSTYKSILSTSSDDINAAGGGVCRNVGTWRSTSAISTVYLFVSNGYKIGTTATIYGIKAA